jgi:hypothetical protein
LTALFDGTYNPRGNFFPGDSIMLRRRQLLVMAVLVLGSAMPAAAQYGPGGYGGSGGGFGQGGYGQGGYGQGGYGSDYGGYPAGSRPGYYEPADRIGGPMGGPDYRPMTRGYGEPVYEPEVVYESYQYCTSCNQRVSDSASVGQRCPHCGVLWTSGAGSSSLASGSGGSSIPAFTLQGARIGRIVGVVVALVLSLFGYAVRQSMRGGSPPAQVRKAPSAAPNFAGFTPEKPSLGSTGEHSITEIRRRLRPGNGGQS